MLLNGVIFPKPYGDAYTDFNVVCTQQMVLNTERVNI